VTDRPLALAGDADPFGLFVATLERCGSRAAALGDCDLAESCMQLAQAQTHGTDAGTHHYLLAVAAVAGWSMGTYSRNTAEQALELALAMTRELACCTARGGSC
jgi:hypothetical protein